MKHVLAAYFSASGSTEALAKRLADIAGADLYQIQPELPYSKEDLDWTNPMSRTSVEMKDRSYRPAITGKVGNMEQYDTIYVGFPIWWYVAPTIINTFLEQYDFTGKTIIPFATSGGSGMGKTNQELAGSCPGAILMQGRRFLANAGDREIKAWIETVQDKAEKNMR